MLMRPILTRRSEENRTVSQRSPWAENETGLFRSAAHAPLRNERDIAHKSYRTEKRTPLLRTTQVYSDEAAVDLEGNRHQHLKPRNVHEMTVESDHVVEVDVVVAVGTYSAADSCTSWSSNWGGATIALGK